MISDHSSIQASVLVDSVKKARPGSAPRLRLKFVPTVPAPLRWSFLLFILCLPFDEVDLGFMSGDLSIARISGLIFFGIYFLYRNPVTGRSGFPPLPRALWFFAAYVCIFLIRHYFDSTRTESILYGVSTLVQLLIFLWVSADLLRDEKLARRSLFAYAVSSSILALGLLGLVPGLSEENIGERVAAFETNPNTAAQHIVLSLLSIMGLVLCGAFPGLRAKVFVTPLGLALIAGLVASGSRAALVAFVIGSGLYLWPHWRSRRVVKSFVIAAFGIGAIIFLVARDPEFVDRIVAASEGEGAGREVIYPVALEMILQDPILGWGPEQALYELGNRLGLPKGRDAHNLYLDIFLSVGLIGAIPFFIGLGLCVHSALKGRTVGGFWLIPLALITANLLACLFHTNITWKPQWLVFAFAIAAGANESFGRTKEAYAAALQRRRPSGRVPMKNAVRA